MGEVKSCLTCTRVVDAPDDSGIIESKYMYLIACNNHIIENYIPASNDTSCIKHGHKIHLFIDDINFLSLAAFLTDFIKSAYAITGRKVTIHIPSSRTMLIDMVNDICRLGAPKCERMYNIENMTCPVKFLYQYDYTGLLKNKIHKKFVTITIDRSTGGWSMSKNELLEWRK